MAPETKPDPSTFHSIEDELKHWKKCARWMASVHAANYHIAELSRTSQSERIRLKNIIDECTHMLEGVFMASDAGWATEDDKREQALERCKSHSKLIQDILDKKKR